MTGGGASVPAWGFGLSLAAFGPNLILILVVGWAISHGRDGASMMVMIGLTAISCACLLASAVAWRRPQNALAIFAAAVQLAPLASFIPFLIASALR